MNRKEPHKNKAPVLGVDIGRVIIEGDGPDTNFLQGSDAEAMRAPAMAGAFDALTRLCEAFEGRVWLVSKCGDRIQERTRKWLDRHRFFQTTGIPYGQLRFCKNRKDKAPICVELGIELFVDDRADVLLAMAGLVPHRFQFGAESSPADILPVPTWPSAERAILSRVNEPPVEPIDQAAIDANLSDQGLAAQ